MSRFRNGWIKVHRKMWDGDIRDNAYLFAIWLDLLCDATIKETKIIWDGDQRILPPGSVVFGYREYADRTGVSVNTVRKWVTYLAKTGRCRVESSSKGTIITIGNWEKYQAREPGYATVDTPSDTPSENQVIRQVNLIEEVRIKEEYIPPHKIERSALGECIKNWGLTLTKFKITKDPKFDEVTIARLIQTHGPDKTKLALLGAGLESSSDSYNPAKHCRITRLLKTDIFEKCVNLGAQNSEPSLRRITE